MNIFWTLFLTKTQKELERVLERNSSRRDLPHIRPFMVAEGRNREGPGRMDWAGEGGPQTTVARHAPRNAPSTDHRQISTSLWETDVPLDPVRRLRAGDPAAPIAPSSVGIGRRGWRSSRAQPKTLRRQPFRETDAEPGVGHRKGVAWGGGGARAAWNAKLARPSRPARDVKNVRQIEAHSEHWSVASSHVLGSWPSPAGGAGPGGAGRGGDDAMRVTAVSLRPSGDAAAAWQF